MNASGASAGLGLVSAASWGGSDFAGGLGARRAPALLVAASGQSVSLLPLGVACAVFHASLPLRHDFLLAAIAGFEGALALAIFYRALAMGAMGITAALTGLLTALVPVVFSMTHYGLPSAVTASGLATGCAAIWLIAHQPQTAEEKNPLAGRALLMGSLAGVGFGAQLTLFKLASGSSVLGVMTVGRGAGVLALMLVLAFARPRGSGRPYLAAAIFAGLLDTGGNIFYLRAAQIGRLDAAAVVSSLYPAGTILLAAIVLREHPSRRQMAGMALALVAVALLSH